MPPASSTLWLYLKITSGIAGLVSTLFGFALRQNIAYMIRRRFSTHAGRPPTKKPRRVWVIFWGSAILGIGLSAISSYAPSFEEPTPKIELNIKAKVNDSSIVNIATTRLDDYESSEKIPEFPAGFITFPAIISIQNLSGMTVSIKDVRFIPFNLNEPIGGQIYGVDTSINLGDQYFMWASEPFEIFPVSIEDGKVEKIEISIGWPLHNEAYSLLKTRKAESNAAMTFYKSYVILAEIGKSLDGASVNAYFNPQCFLLFYNVTSKPEVFLHIEVDTYRGTTHIFDWYIENPLVKHYGEHD